MPLFALTKLPLSSGLPQFPFHRPDDGELNTVDRRNAVLRVGTPPFCRPDLGRAWAAQQQPAAERETGGEYGAAEDGAEGVHHPVPGRLQRLVQRHQPPHGDAGQRPSGSGSSISAARYQLCSLRICGSAHGAAQNISRWWGAPRKVRAPDRCRPRCSVATAQFVKMQASATLFGILGQASPENSGLGERAMRLSLKRMPCQWTQFNGDPIVPGRKKLLDRCSSRRSVAVALSQSP